MTTQAACVIIEALAETERRLGVSVRPALGLLRAVVAAPRTVGRSVRQGLRAQEDRWREAPTTAQLLLGGVEEPALVAAATENIRKGLIGPDTMPVLALIAGGFAAWRLANAQTVVAMIVGLAALYAAVTFGSSLIRWGVLDDAVDAGLNVIGTAVLTLVAVEVAVNVLPPHAAGGLIAHDGIVHAWIESHDAVVHGVALGLFACVVAAGGQRTTSWMSMARGAYSTSMGLFGTAATIALCVSLIGLAPETGEQALLRDPVLRQRSDEAAAKAQAAEARDEANWVTHNNLETAAESALGQAFIAQLAAAVIQSIPTRPPYDHSSAAMDILKPERKRAIRFSAGARSWIDVVQFPTTCCSRVLDGLDDHRILRVTHQAMKEANDPTLSDAAKFTIVEAITSLLLPGLEPSGGLAVGAANAGGEGLAEAIGMKADLSELYERFSQSWSSSADPANEFRRNLRSWKRFRTIAQRIVRTAMLKPTLSVSSGVARTNDQHDEIGEALSEYRVAEQERSLRTIESEAKRDGAGIERGAP